MDNPTVKVTNLNVQYDKNTRKLVFDVAGVSTEVQKVQANMIVSAYGKQIYTKTFNPCETGMKEMCPSKSSPLSRHFDRVLTVVQSLLRPFLRAESKRYQKNTPPRSRPSHSRYPISMVM